MDRAHPGLLAGLALVAHVDLRGRVVADEHRRQARRPAARAANAATSAATRSRTAAATALPSISPRRHR